MIPSNPNDGFYQSPAPPTPNEGPTLEQQAKPDNRVFRLFTYSTILWFFVAIPSSIVGLFAGPIGFLIIFSIIFGGGVIFLIIVYSVLYQLMRSKFIWLNERVKYRSSMFIWSILIVVSMVLIIPLVFRVVSLFYNEPAKQVNTAECEDLARQIVDNNSLPDQEYTDKGCSFATIDKMQKQKDNIKPEIKTLNYKASIFGIDFNFDYQSDQKIRAQSWGYVLDFANDASGSSRKIDFRFIESYPEVFDVENWQGYKKTTISGYPARTNFEKMPSVGVLIGDRLMQVICSIPNDPTAEQKKEFAIECEKVVNTLKITKAPAGTSDSQNSDAATSVTTNNPSTSQTPSGSSYDLNDPYNVLNPTNFEKTTGYKPSWIYGEIISFTSTQLVVAEEGKNQNLTLPIISDTIITDGSQKTDLSVGAYVNIEYEGFSPVHVLRVRVQK